MLLKWEKMKKKYSVIKIMYIYKKDLFALSSNVKEQTITGSIALLGPGSCSRCLPPECTAGREWVRRRVRRRVRRPRKSKRYYKDKGR